MSYQETVDRFWEEQNEILRVSMNMWRKENGLPEQPKPTYKYLPEEPKPARFTDEELRTFSPEDHARCLREHTAWRKANGFKDIEKKGVQPIYIRMGTARKQKHDDRIYRPICSIGTLSPRGFVTNDRGEQIVNWDDITSLED